MAVDSDDDEDENEDDSEVEGREEGVGASEGAFAGGDGKFTYIGALKGSHLGKGKGKKKGEGKGEKKSVPPVDVSGSGLLGDKVSAALSEFPPLCPSLSVNHDDASVATTSVQNNMKDLENDAESGDVADRLCAVRLEDEEEHGRDTDEQGDGEESNDDSNGDHDGDSEEERGDEEEEDGEESDVEDDISRYQREIEEEHKEKEAQALKDVSLASNCGGLTVQAVDSAIECALLKVKLCTYMHTIYKQ